MRIVLFFISIFIINFCFSQEKYWVYLTDKDGVEFNPTNYFDQKAINRRVKNNIPLNHYTDRPLREDYQQIISKIADTVCGHTRWFNAIACKLTQAQLLKIQALPFVKKVTPMVSKTVFAGGNTFDDLHKGEKELLEGQIDWMKGKEFTKNGFTGKGIRICIIDAGFPDVNTSQVYQHIREQNHIIKTWDFVKNKSDVYKFNSHGSTVLSCIAGKIDGVFIGLAVDAEFLEKQFQPEFSASDIVGLDNRNAYMALLVNGKPVRPFNMRTIDLDPVDMTKVEPLKQMSYEKYGRPLAEVNAEIAAKYAKPTPPPQPADPFAPAVQ